MAATWVLSVAFLRSQSVAGPLIGGWITEAGLALGVLLNLPLAILSILAVIFLLPHRPFREREAQHRLPWFSDS